MDLEALDAMDRSEFVATLGGVFEHSPWIALHAFGARPFASVAALHAAMVDTVRQAAPEAQLALLRAHPELAGRAAIRGALTADSAGEQSGAGLTQCTAAEYARLTALNAAYGAKFGFPFIVAVKGLDRAAILREFARRIESDRDAEFAEALAQVERIARLRLDALFPDG